MTPLTLDLQELARGNVVCLDAFIQTTGNAEGGGVTVFDLTEPLNDRTARMVFTHPTRWPSSKLANDMAGWALKQIHYAVTRAIRQKGH